MLAWGAATWNSPGAGKGAIHAWLGWAGGVRWLRPYPSQAHSRGPKALELLIAAEAGVANWAQVVAGVQNKRQKYTAR